MKQPQLKNYVNWEHPTSPYNAPTSTFHEIERVDLIVNPHWVTEYADQGYISCRVSLINGYQEEFVSKDKVEDIVANLKERFKVCQVLLYQNYNWTVM